MALLVSEYDVMKLKVKLVSFYTSVNKQLDRTAKHSGKHRKSRK